MRDASKQEDINNKIEANEKMRKICLAMLEDHREINNGDSCQTKVQHTENERNALKAARRRYLPMQHRIEKQNGYMDRLAQ